jgi:hypothetical protein
MRAMNELQLIQTQLALERRHAVEIAAECAGGAPGAEFLKACGDYLERVLGWFAERDQRFMTLAQSLPEGSATAPCVPSGQSREALPLLAAARSGGDWAPLSDFLCGPWSQRRAALEQWLAEAARIADWRTVSALTADVILSERELYARTRRLRPSGAARAGERTELRHGKS